MNGDGGWGWNEVLVNGDGGGDSTGTAFTARLIGRGTQCSVLVGGKLREEDITVVDTSRCATVLVPGMGTRFSPLHMYVLQLIGEAHTLCSPGDARWVAAACNISGFGRHNDKSSEGTTGERARFVQTLCDGIRNAMDRLSARRQHGDPLQPLRDIVTCKVLLNDVHWEVLGLGLRLDADANFFLESLTAVGTVQQARYAIHPPTTYTKGLPCHASNTHRLSSQGNSVGPNRGADAGAVRRRRTGVGGGVQNSAGG